MRVLHVYKDVFPPVVGGIERHIDSIRQALPDMAHDVLVCSGSRRTRTNVDANGREVLAAEFGRLWSTPISPAFPLWLRRLSPGALLHVHMPNPLGELSAMTARGKAPMVVTYHADIHRQRALLPIYRPLLHRCLQSADAVITGSHQIGRSSPILLGAGIATEVVPFGVDTNAWGGLERDSRAVDELRSQIGGPHVLAVGRLVTYKGFDRLIAAAPDFTWPVVIVGDGPQRTVLQRQIEDLGLAGRVQLVGRVGDDRLREHLAAADIFVLPSVNRAEAFGIALLEAQAAGLPVIATDVGTATAEAFQPGLTGLLIPSDDRAALADAINQLANAPQLRSQMAASGRTFVEAHHSLAAMASKLRPIYERALSSA